MTTRILLTSTNIQGVVKEKEEEEEEETPKYA